MQGIKRNEVKNLGLASLGATLEYYDFVVYVFVATAIGQAFFPPDIAPWLKQLQVFSIYALGYFVRPFAGIVIAHFADRIGRKRLFVFTVFLMSVPTMLMGLLPTYDQAGWIAPVLLIILRILQGCAVGGELPSAATFIAEHARPSRLGFASGTLHAVVHCGLLLGSGSAAIAAMIASIDPEYASLAWRLPFIVGGLCGLFAAYLRRHLEETPMFVAEKAKSSNIGRTPFAVVVTRYRGAVMAGLGIYLMMAFTNALFFQYMPTYLVSQHGFTPRDAFMGGMAGTVALALPMVFWGWLSDRIGQRKVIVIGAALSALVGTWFFDHLPSIAGDRNGLMLAFIPVGIVSGCVISIVPAFIASLFPTSVRQSGYAVPYNIGAAAFAGPAPLLFAWSVNTYGLNAPLYLFLGACGVVAVTSLLSKRLNKYLGPEAEADGQRLSEGAFAHVPSKAH
jgi:MFS family permease